MQIVMSALLPKADMCSALGDVCFVPIADIHYLIRSLRQSARVEKIEKVPTASGNTNLSHTHRSN